MCKLTKEYVKHECIQVSRSNDRFVFTRLSAIIVPILLSPCSFLLLCRRSPVQR